MHDAVERALASGFPDRAVAAVEATPDSAHPGNRTVAVRFADGDRAYLKVRTDGDRERNRREAAVTRYAGEHCRVRTPRVLAAESSADPPFLATAPLAGQQVSDAWGGDGDQLAELAREVGRAVGGVASATFDRPGWITGGDADRLDVDAGRWSEVLASAVEHRAATIPYPERFAAVPDRVAELLRNAETLLDGAPATLVHADLRRENVFRDGHPGVVDWEWSLVGDPGLALCWAVARVVERGDVPSDRRERLRESLQDGYRDVASGRPAGIDDRQPVYRLVTFLPTVQTFDRWAPTAAESTADLAGWVRSEFDERLAAAETAVDV